METITEKGPRHWGSYDGVDHGFESRAMSPIHRPSYVYPYEQPRGLGIDPTEPVAMDPGLPTVDWSALSATEVRGALQYVRSELQPGLMQALRATTFEPQIPYADHGSIKPSLSTTGQGWADQQVAAGNAVLVDLRTLGADAIRGPEFYWTGQPAAIASSARAGAPYAIVDIPPGIDALAQQAAVALALPTPPGLLAKPSTGFPWKPVALIGGGLVLVAGIVAATRKKR